MRWPALHLLELGGERVTRRRVVGLDVENLVVGVHDHHVELQTIAVDLDHVVEERDLLLGAGPGRLVDGVLHHLDERVPALGLPVHARQLAARCPRLRRGGNELLPGVHALVHGELLSLDGRGGLSHQLGRKILDAVGSAVAGLGLFVSLRLACLLGLLLHFGAPPRLERCPHTCSVAASGKGQKLLPLRSAPRLSRRH